MRETAKIKSGFFQPALEGGKNGNNNLQTSLFNDWADAEVDNCDTHAIIVAVKADDPMSAGCVDRYLTTDGVLLDCSIDFVDFAQWFELEELEELEGNE